MNFAVKVSVDPRISREEVLECPNCGKGIEITHKHLYKSMWKKEQIAEEVGGVELENDYRRLAKVNCFHCHTPYIITYDFEEFAMNAYAYHLHNLIVIDK